MIFGLFKEKKVDTEVDTEWLENFFEDLVKLCGKENGKTVCDFYNLAFIQLKTNVFTLLAPVNLKDDEKMKEFYRHKFSLGYVYGLVFTLLQYADFMKENQNKLHEMLAVALMKQLFNFTEKSARDIFSQARTTFQKDKTFARGLTAGANDWFLFTKERFKGMIGHHFAQEFDMLKKDLE